jgi:hypothetical protein
MFKFFAVQIITFVLLISSSFNAFAQTTTPEPTPTGQVVSLNFSINGIGPTGNSEPQTKTRGIELLFYDSQINAYDRSVKPLFSFSAGTEFDANPDSASYGKFINEKIDLSDKVPSGNYQIVLKVDKLLPRLVGKGESGVGGEVFEIGEFSSDKIVITEENLLPGDIYPVPAGDSVLDAFDYNLLAACFGISDSASSSCADKKSADLDDNGILDGVDYNLMVSSVMELARLGFPVPVLGSISPTRAIVLPTPTKVVEKKEPEPSRSVESAESGGSPWIIVLVFVLLAIFIFVIIKRKKMKDFFSAMLKKKSKREKISENIDSSSEAKAENTEEKIDKEYFVKKQAFDDKNKVTVLTLTDDSGPTLGYFAKEDIQDGFAKVKGTLKKEGDKVYVDVSDISPIDPS